MVTRDGKCSLFSVLSRRFMVELELRGVKTWGGGLSTTEYTTHQATRHGSELGGNLHKEDLERLVRWCFWVVTGVSGEHNSWLYRLEPSDTLLWEIKKKSSPSRQTPPLPCPLKIADDGLVLQKREAKPERNASVPFPRRRSESQSTLTPGVGCGTGDFSLNSWTAFHLSRSLWLMSKDSSSLVNVAEDRTYVAKDCQRAALIPERSNLSMSALHMPKRYKNVWNSIFVETWKLHWREQRSAREILCTSVFQWWLCQSFVRL